MAKINRKTFPVQTFFPILLGLVLVTACQSNSLSTQEETPSLPITVTTQYLSTFTLTATETPLPAPSSTPTVFLKPTMVWTSYQAGDTVTVPILMYHRIQPSEQKTRFNVTPEEFAAQMQLLADWGYQTITIAHLVDVLKNGGEVPPRPVILTFDDGYDNNYQNAFPVMQQHGFVGVLYLPAVRINIDGFLTLEEIKEMIDAGWEFGSHSSTHADLTANHQTLLYEIKESKTMLSEQLGVEIQSFAYPFGLTDNAVDKKVKSAGYTNAVGLIKTWTHNQFDLFYLGRLEVNGLWDMELFKTLLPWQAP